MDELLERVVFEEAKELGISVELFKELANKGSQIAFKDDFISRINSFGGLDFFDEERLRSFLLSLVEGATALIQAGKYIPKTNIEHN